MNCNIIHIYNKNNVFVSWFNAILILNIMEYKPLHKAGFINIKDDQLSSTFIEPFENNTRREYLLERFYALTDKFKETGINAEIWIDGSFATFKPEPGDIDIVFIIDSEQIRTLSNDKKRILVELNNRMISKIRYKCDVFIIPQQDENAKSYWRGWFGFSRNEEPKGIIRLYI